MLRELFDTLPRRLTEDQLLTRLTSEVDVLSRQQPAVFEKRQASATPKPIVASSSVRPAGRVTAPGETMPLFLPQSGAITHEPSDKLVKRAELLERFDPSIFGGYILRFMVDRKTKVAKAALLAPAIAECLIEIPLTIGPAAAFQKLREKRFTKRLIKEYPHLGVESYNPGTYSLIGGSAKDFARAVLAHPEPAQVEKDISGQQPPNQAQTSAAGQPVKSNLSTDRNIVPIVGLS